MTNRKPVFRCCATLYNKGTAFDRVRGVRCGAKARFQIVFASGGVTYRCGRHHKDYDVVKKVEL